VQSQLRAATPQQQQPTPPPPVASQGQTVDISAADIPTQLRFRFKDLPQLPDIPPHSHVFLTFSNGHYSNLMLNAAALIADLGRPIVVLAFDNATAETCEQYGLPYMWSDVRMDTVDFRQDRCSCPAQVSPFPEIAVHRPCSCRLRRPCSSSMQLYRMPPCTDEAVPDVQIKVLADGKSEAAGCRQAVRHHPGTNCGSGGH
jgi:hypothetical protein